MPDLAVASTHARNRDLPHPQTQKARHRVGKTLADWGITDELADDIVLSANELVTNAVTHCKVTCAQVRVTLVIREPYPFLEVHDPDRDRLPESHDSEPDDESGRGLTLLGRLAHGWGHGQLRHTKCVWARFALPEGTYGPAVS